MDFKETLKIFLLNNVFRTLDEYSSVNEWLLIHKLLLILIFN
jgi:hypothetical protein